MFGLLPHMTGYRKFQACKLHTKGEMYRKKTLNLENTA
jgi:hypothetical protein